MPRPVLDYPIGIIRLTIIEWGAAMRILTAALVVLCIAARSQCQPAPTKPITSISLPDIRVDYFGAEKGYAVGSNAVTMLCVLRNVGRAALPEGTLRVR